MRKTIKLLAIIMVLFACTFAVNAVRPDNPGKSEDAGKPEDLPPINTYNDVAPEIITPSTQIDNTPAAQKEMDKDNGPADIVKPEKTTVMINSKYLTGESSKTTDKLPEGILIEPEYVNPDLGYQEFNDPNAYTLLGARMDNNPGNQIVFHNDRNFQREKLDLTKTLDAISSAAETWDAATRSQNLFSDSGIGTTTSGSYAGNGLTDIAFIGIVGKNAKNILGFNAITTDPKSPIKVANGETYPELTETDIFYNSMFTWTTGTGYYDVNTITLHELGHTVGLGDTYLHDTFKYDKSQIMGYYWGPQNILGDGDKNGVLELWGK
jgi:hypothetical protein